MAWGDLVAGELHVADDTTLLAMIELALLPEMQPGVAYIFLFAADDRDWYAGAVTVPTLEFVHGPWGSEETGPDDIYEATGSYTSGVRGSITIEIPRGKLGDVSVLSQPRGLVADIKADALPVVPGGIVILDRAEGEGEIRFARNESAASTAPAAEPTEEDVAPAAAADPGSPAPPSKASVPATGAASASLGAVVGAIVGACRASRRTR